MYPDLHHRDGGRFDRPTPGLRALSAWIGIMPVLLGGCGGATPFGVPDGGADLLVADASRTETNVGTGGMAMATVTLDGTASTTPNGATVTYVWVEAGEVIATGVTVEVDLAPGVHDITLLLSDDAERTASDRIELTVVDDMPGSFALVIGISGAGETVPPAGLSWQPIGETIRLQARAADGFRFVRWSGDLDSANSTPVILIDRDLSITAEFTPLIADALPRLFLPWAPGVSWSIAQGNDGAFSHQDQFAWDVPMPVRTPVLAAAAGRVIDVLGENRRDDDTVLSSEDEANFVVIDHGAGLQSYYAHLDFMGTTVVAEQDVVRGQVIGYSGNTGLSTAPHLHYEVRDTTGASVATGFFEVDDNDGVPMQGDTVTSANELNIRTGDSYVPSPLAADAFLENGVELTGDIPPADFYFNETDYVLSGEILDGKTRVCAALVDPDTRETVHCELTEVDVDGTFAHSFRFPAEIVGPYFFGVITGDSGAEGFASRIVRVSPPVDLDDRPVASIDQPDDLLIDFLQTRVLVSTQSSSPVGRALTYQWTQASGPPAVITDPAEEETEFYLEPAEGGDRVSFQLVVFDGELYSQPDQVDFFMPDTFFVKRIGVSDEVCLSAGECPVPPAPPPAVSFSTQVLQAWVEVLGAETGDSLKLSITNPAGDVEREDTLLVESEPSPVSFWRVVWSSNGLELLPGDWQVVFERNGRAETTLDFRAIP